MSKVTIGVMVTLLSFLTLTGQAGASQEKVTICHAAGLEGTSQFVEITAAYPAIYGQAGHFLENGTPRAGHEDDYVGSCDTPDEEPEVCPIADALDAGWTPGGDIPCAHGDTPEDATPTTTIPVCPIADAIDAGWTPGGDIPCAHGNSVPDATAPPTTVEVETSSTTLVAPTPTTEVPVLAMTGRTSASLGLLAGALLAAGLILTWMAKGGNTDEVI